MRHGLQKNKVIIKEKFKQSKLRQNKLRNYSILFGVLLGAVIGFVYRVVYWTEAFKVSSIFEQFRWLGPDILSKAFFGCLLGGLLGFIVGLVIIKYKLKYE